jgi:beta-galactosidase
MKITFLSRGIAAALFAIAALSAPMCAVAAPPAPRASVDLDPGWRFRKTDTPGAEAPAFDDAAWAATTLPHTYNADDGADGGNNYYRGVGWYRRHLRLDRALAGKSLFLQFDGAATVTDVFVNGKPAGEHRGDFGAFCFDVTSLLKPGADNVIAVKVDNAKQADVAPLSADFTFYGGLYRDVRLLVLDPLSVTPLDDAGPGVYVAQTKVSERSADLTVTVRLRNGGATDRIATVRSVVTDATGKTAGAVEQNQRIPAGGVADAAQSITLASPHLWNGVSDPYLYHVTTEILDGKRVVDRVEQPLGVRYFRVDPNAGLFLNGKHYALHGINRHQDRQGKGWAISAADHAQDYALIREMGSTGIRLSHYQHAQAFYNLCDQGGLVVWAEIPLVNSLNPGDAFASNAKQQLRELIKQNYNHPSILFWSLFNELHFPGGSKNPAEWALIGDLNTLAHQLDPSRLTTAASNLTVEHPANFITDVIAFNRYPGWYGGKATDWPRMLDDMHRRYPERSIAISEYGAGASIHQHEQWPPAQPKAGGKWHPEEWQAQVHEDAWQAMSARPWIWGTFLWAMYDFGSDGRNEGDMPGRNDKGMVTFDRQTRKDSFNWYKANWSDTPFVAINSRRFTPRPATPSTIRIYSNCPTVELFLNGVSLGAKTAPDHRFVWDAAALTLGENRVRAVATQAGKTFTDECVWTGITPPAPAAAPIVPAAK